MSGWIVIPRWEDFQHRDAARSNVPPWIKLYTELLSHDDFLRLTFRQRGILIGIWLEYARSRRKLGASVAQLGRRLGDETVRTRDLEALEQAGFIVISASKPASNVARNPASLEERREEETPPTHQRLPQTGRAGGTSTNGDFELVDPHGVLADIQPGGLPATPPT